MTPNQKRAATNAARAQAEAERPVSSTEWREALAGIDRSREDAAARLRQIAEERRGLALAAHAGDRAATTTMSALNAEAGELVAKVDTSNLAEGLVRENLAKAEAREAAEVELEHQRQAARIAGLLAGLAAEIDRGFREDLERIARREALLNELGAYDSGRAMRMKSRAQRILGFAAEAAGLGGAIGYRPGGNAFRKSLELLDREMLADLLSQPVASPDADAA
jgi:hypothetical protein